MTICPKCGGTTIFDARDDAPSGVKDWVRCLCGKRWDPSKQAAPAAVPDVMAMITRAFDEWQPDEEAPTLARDAEDEETELELQDDGEELEPIEEVETPTDLAMKDVRVKRGRPKKEAGMASVWTPERREKFNATMAAKRGEEIPAKKRGRPRKFANAAHRQAVEDAADRSKALQADEQLPAVTHPKGLPAPRLVSSNVLSVIDAAIVSTHADVAALERTREILTRGQA